MIFYFKWVLSQKTPEGFFLQKFLSEAPNWRESCTKSFSCLIPHGKSFGKCLMFLSFLRIISNQRSFVSGCFSSKRKKGRSITGHHLLHLDLQLILKMSWGKQNFVLQVLPKVLEYKFVTFPQIKKKNSKTFSIEHLKNLFEKSTNTFFFFEIPPPPLPHIASYVRCRQLFVTKSFFKLLLCIINNLEEKKQFFIASTFVFLNGQSLKMVFFFKVFFT